MNKRSVLAAIEYGQTVCWRTSRYHVTLERGFLWVRDVHTSARRALIEDVMDKCFIYTGGVGSDDV